MKVLCIGAHPDDIEYAVGGTIQKHLINGDEIKCVILTDGGDRDEKGNHTFSPVRRNESIQALTLLGVADIQFLSMPQIKNSGKNRSMLEKEIQEYNPNRIYTHTIHDRHQEHRNTYKIVQSVARYACEIFLFEIYSATPEFQPYYFIEISEDILQKKIEAFKLHQSQFGSNEISIEKIITANAVFRACTNFGGRKEFVPYAEAFEILKIFKRNDDV